MRTSLKYCKAHQHLSLALSGAHQLTFCNKKFEISFPGSTAKICAILVLLAPNNSLLWIARSNPSRTLLLGRPS